MGIKFYINFTFRNIGCDYLFNNINFKYKFRCIPV